MFIYNTLQDALLKKIHTKNSHRTKTSTGDNTVRTSPRSDILVSKNRNAARSRNANLFNSSNGPKQDKHVITV